MELAQVLSILRQAHLAMDKKLRSRHLLPGITAVSHQSHRNCQYPTRLSCGLTCRLLRYLNLCLRQILHPSNGVHRYDLLADDAVNNIQRHNLGFDEGAFSRRQSPVRDTESIDPQLETTNPAAASIDSTAEPWNSAVRLHLTDDELPLFQHFIDVLGPVMDLFDPLRHFTMLIPRIAVHNLGVLKSLLAVAARHMALHAEKYSTLPVMNVQTLGSALSGTSAEIGGHNPLARLAVQYYYETLHYLSQNLLYPSYNKSGEIIATAILISTYEMFDAGGSYSNGDWERHLHGIFWIQRAQNNNGESADGLRRAAWWAWLRQDIWVAFRESRRTLTIWRPTKRLMALTPDELALRIVYIAARCVDFAANEKHYDMNIRIEQGDKLLQALEDWHRALPPTFQPIYAQRPSEVGIFSPIWIHPPSYAAAIQTFHFARIVTLINQPSMGGMNEFRHRQRYLDESVDTICGIAVMHQAKDLLSSFVDVMSVYAAGLCVQNPARQRAVLSLLEKCLNVSKFPPKTLLDDLTKYWRGES
ncbi:hypothetical protein BDV96DRAFT_24835 [Lophiotrema nucula]|uniref:Fungal-specific transcription factor domain-containing protein n=1 Tax=Lophiotrema nucula TaxID=690887 RepID=A0A6A5ZF85_9PLEO|nr:hypothetical protein BDV96DRAFT_24835 [Lophiotrema nucula]